MKRKRKPDTSACSRESEGSSSEYKEPRMESGNVAASPKSTSIATSSSQTSSQASGTTETQQRLTQESFQTLTCSALDSLARLSRLPGREGGFKDTHRTLFFEICRIAKEKKARFLFLENVKGLLNHQAGKSFKVIIKTLAELGYDIQWQILNSKHFGVPQNCERVFIAGHLRGKPRPKVFPLREDAAEVLEVSKRETKVFRGRPRYDKKRKRGPKFYEYDEMATLSRNWVAGDQQNIIYTQERKGRRKDKDASRTLKRRTVTGGNNVPMVANALRTGGFKNTNPKYCIDKKMGNLVNVMNLQPRSKDRPSFRKAIKEEKPSPGGYGGNTSQVLLQRSPSLVKYIFFHGNLKSFVTFSFSIKASRTARGILISSTFAVSF